MSKYVARYTECPEYDIERGWSAFMGHTWSSERRALIDQLEAMTGEYGYRGVAWDDLDTDRLREIAERKGIDIRYHEYHKVWCLVHHEGLACFGLKATNVLEAIIESANGFPAVAFEHAEMTVGKVELVCAHPSQPGMYIFRCEDYESEPL